ELDHIMLVAFLSNLFLIIFFSNLASRNDILKATSNNISCLKLFSKHLFISILFPNYTTDNKTATPPQSGMTALIAKLFILVPAV
ncbi:hypothetical protein, partial [Paenibacillus polymyxa]|uniref:hypothetical protein n=1 Tax=Paenibacillus polymyxa TaxID=1406 RepID=UPI001FF06955